MMNSLPPLFAFLPDMSQLVVLMVVAVMLFGKRLPEVAKQVGRGIAEAKKHISGLQAELNSAIYSDVSSTSGSLRGSSSVSSYSYNDYDDRDEQTAPKFEPPPAEPQA